MELTSTQSSLPSGPAAGYQKIPVFEPDFSVSGPEKLVPGSQGFYYQQMIGLIQRVSSASVVIAQQETARIEGGVLALIGVEKADTLMSAGKLLDKILDYRIFADEQGRMNLSLRKTGGGLLLVPQFTLVADTSRGLRPGFSTGARPADAQTLFDALVVTARSTYPEVAAGTFGADMQVSLVNDGPVTFWLHIEPE